MEILIRKEPNGSIYIDKKNAQYYETLNMSEPPYNFTKIEIETKYCDCERVDFDDDLKFNVKKYNERKKNNRLLDLRLQRENECFPIINRGQLWYDTLTEKQQLELKKWYQLWLDVTQTEQIPEKPSWLK